MLSVMPDIQNCLPHATVEEFRRVSAHLLEATGAGLGRHDRRQLWPLADRDSADEHRGKAGDRGGLGPCLRRLPAAQNCAELPLDKLF